MLDRVQDACGCFQRPFSLHQQHTVGREQTEAYTGAPLPSKPLSLSQFRAFMHPSWLGPSASWLGVSWVEQHATQLTSLQLTSAVGLWCLQHMYSQQGLKAAGMITGHKGLHQQMLSLLAISSGRSWLLHLHSDT